jgi:hypothetical protein
MERSQPRCQLDAPAGETTQLGRVSGFWGRYAGGQVSSERSDEMGVAGGANQVQNLGLLSRPKLREADSGLERAEGKLFRPDTWRKVLVL